MSAHEYLRVLRRRWRWVVALVCAGAAFAAFSSWSTPPTYRATSSVFFSLPFGNSANDLAQGSTFAQNQASSYALLATTPTVLGPVIVDLDLDASVRQLAEQVSTAVVPDTVVVEVSATDATPESAAQLANAVTEQLVITVGDLAPVDDEGRATVTATTVARAEPSSAPVAPRTTLNVAVGLLAGLALGVLLAVAREMTDTRVRTREDLSQLTELPLLASFDNPGEKGGRRELVVATSPRSVEAESFRSLRTAVQFSVRPGAPLALLVTSSRPAEGKSTVAANLALAMADAGLRVVLVDADLRRPSVAATFDLVDSVGLTNVLIGQVELDDALQSYGTSGLQVLTAGPLPPNPSELLATPDMVQLLERLGATFDVVVVDSPPLLSVTDATILSRLVDRTVVVSDASRSRRGALGQSLGLLEQAGGRVAGLVFTHVRRSGDDVYGYEAWEPAAEPRTTRPRAIMSRLGRGRGSTPVTNMLVKLPPPGATAPDRLPPPRPRTPAGR